jgi:hypothetical protein
MFITFTKAFVKDAASSRRISGASVSARNRALVKTAFAMAGSILGMMLVCKKESSITSKYAIGDRASGRVGT